MSLMNISFEALAQSDSIVVSIPNSESIDIVDLIQIYEYKIEEDSIWRTRTETGVIIAEGNFVKQYRPLYDDYILVKHGIHNYYSLSGFLVLRETYLNGNLINRLIFNTNKSDRKCTKMKKTNNQKRENPK